MHHTIKAEIDFMADLEVSPRHRLEWVKIRRGARLRAQVRPYVVETEEGPVEVADLNFADGTTARMVPFEYFSFLS